jgi:HPt (histidine-containing phosphotransfer) domain-containing protein
MTEDAAKRAALSAKLRELGARFTERNVGDLAALEACVERLRSGAPDALGDIEAIAHRMSGTGATLGFQAISAAAERLERLAGSPTMNLLQLTAAVANLRDAIGEGEQRA